MRHTCPNPTTPSLPLPPDKEAKPYIFNMGKRFVSCFATGHTLRAATYLATVVPGAGEHCLPGATGLGVGVGVGVGLGLG